MYNEIDKIIIDGQVCLGLPIYNNVRNRIHYGNIKKDWKLYRVKLAKYQENYIEYLNQEYITLLSDKEKIPSEKLWELEKRIKKDRRHPGVIIDVQKSTAIWTITNLLKMQVISRDDLEGFSSDLIDTVNFFLK